MTPLSQDPISARFEHCKNLYLHILATEGSPPAPNRPVFLKDNRDPLTRAEVNGCLQENLMFFGLTSMLLDRFGSHSLRRGGATAYIAAGMDPKLVKEQGRWLGDK